MIKPSIFSLLLGVVPPLLLLAWYRFVKGGQFLPLHFYRDEQVLKILRRQGLSDEQIAWQFPLLLPRLEARRLEERKKVEE